VGLPRWRTTTVHVCWRAVGDQDVGRCRAGNTQGRGRPRCQDSRHHSRIRGGAVARSALARLGQGILGPASVARRWPRPAAASLLAGVARRQRSSADPSGPSGVPPTPAGAGLPADSTRPVAFGSAWGERGRRRATAAAACARRRTGSPRGAYGRCSPRPAAHCAGTGKTGGAPHL
jgi:hypothetical protein